MTHAGATATATLATDLLATDENFRAVVVATIAAAKAGDKHVADKGRMTLALLLAIETKNVDVFDAIYYGARGEITAEERTAKMLAGMNAWLPVATGLVLTVAEAIA